MKPTTKRVALLLVSLFVVAASAPAQQTALPLKLSANGRYFVDQNDAPVFWLGTTQWELFRGYSQEDARAILEESRKNGFTVVQVGFLGVGDGTKPNVYGQKPWLNNDPLMPNDAYFRNVDAVLQMARDDDLIVSVSVFHQLHRKRITMENARRWARWLGNRYKDVPHILWKMAPQAKQEYVPILRELSAGLREGDGGRHLISVQPDPSPYSSSFLQVEDWLAFNTIQTWNGVKLIYPMVTHDYNLKPVKPVVMGEGAYEEGTEYGFPVTPLWVRRQAYYSYLAGGFHSYGHNDSWRVLPTWRKALNAPGAAQMGVLKKIITGRPEWWLLVPDQSVFASGGRVSDIPLAADYATDKERMAYVRKTGVLPSDDQTISAAINHLAARHRDGRWAMLYLAQKATFSVNMNKLSAAKVSALWVDPRTGDSLPAGQHSNAGVKSFSTPGGWEDALLILEAAERAASGAESAASGAPAAATGPLRVHPTNHRYFTDGSGKAVFLTGSHTWCNLQDYTYATLPSPPSFDFDAYLAFLKRHNHNFFRLWCWENSINPKVKQGTIYYHPMPYQRPGPELANDGKPRFDLTRWNEAYFDRLRTRVVAARDNGIYAAVMLFQGFSIEGKGNIGGDPWQGHYYNPKNNINGIDGGGSASVHTLANPAVTALQEAYVRKVIDTVNDLDNVLYEITNEDTGGPANNAWQYHMIRFIKGYEATKPKQHPVGMTCQYPKGSDPVLHESPADWISPGARMPTNDGGKVLVNDTDHSYFWIPLKADGVAAQRAWAWKNFTRGYQCLFMDPYLDPSHDVGRNKPEGNTPDPYWDPLREALGRTRSYATRMSLADTSPRGELASSGFCLANPKREYLVYLPEGGEVTVDLSAAAGELAVEWMQPVEGTTTTGGAVTGGAKRTLKTPFSGDAVLYLRKN